MTDDEICRLTTRFYRHGLVKVEEAIAAGHFAETFVVENILPATLPIGGVFKGLGGLRTYLSELRQHLSIERFLIDRIVVADDEAIVFGTERSSWTGNGVAYDMAWVHVVRFDQRGRYAALREYNDTAAMLGAFHGHARQWEGPDLAAAT